MLDHRGIEIKNSEDAWFYVIHQGQRCPEVEDLLAKDIDYACDYAKTYLKGRFIKAESEIVRWPSLTLQYVEHVVKGRFILAEFCLKDRLPWWNAYREIIGKRKISNTQKWLWLKEDISDRLVSILNYLGMTKEMQEFICEQRPDLISLITNLHPDLKARFQHELSLSKVDL
jgi:hypothetical protein